ncbi:MAG: hypothetical protein KF709_02595 [Gemmatimonadaceae bacterium]|nr:hypothetical protein [Gemmatimonadaceae bacterium]
MPPVPSPAHRLELWSAPAPAGGARQAFLSAGGGGVARLERSRYLESGRSSLIFTLPASHHAAALVVPQQSVIRLVRFVATGPDAYATTWEEWRVLRRRRPVQRTAAVLEFACVPIEDDLLDQHLHREVSGGGLARWGYSATDRTPADVLGDVAAGLAAAGIAWIDVGTVTPTTPVTFALEGAVAPRAIASALVDALATAGVASEFALVRAGDDLSYELTLVERVAGSLAPLIATTDAAAIDVAADDDATEQVNVIVPFTPDRVDLRELQLEVTAVDGGTGWVTLGAIGGAASTPVLVDGQWTGRRLFRELTGRSFAITDSSASPARVRLATTDLSSGLAVGERVSLRQSEDYAGTRQAFGTRAVWSPFLVTGTDTGPPRIETEDLQGGGATVHATNQYRDWEVQRSTLVCALPSGTFDHVAGTWTFAGAPSSTPAAGDWIWCPHGAAFVPGTITDWNGGTNVATVVPRVGGTSFTASASGITTARCYRPAGDPMWIVASATTDGTLTVDAFSGGTPGADDVLEPIQRHQGVRLVEVPHPVAIAATRRRVNPLQVACTGATNRVVNGSLAAWAGASGDPPDGWTITSIVGTVTRARVTDALLTRHGGKAWRLDFAAGASAEIRSPLVPVHAAPGLMQVAAAFALLFPLFTGNVPIDVSIVAVHASGTRTVLGEPIHVYPPDTTTAVDDAQRAALDTWYDAVATNLPLEGLADEQLQLVLARPAGGSNPACSVVLDAVMLLHREGLPEASGGGVHYVFGSDALPMLQAAQELLADRAYPLLRFDARLLDLYRLDGVRYAPFELVPGRDVDLRVPALGLQKTVRLMGLTEDVLDPRAPQVVLDRVRPDVGRLLASRFTAPASDPTEEVSRPPVKTIAPVMLRVRLNLTEDEGEISWSIGATDSVVMAIDDGGFATPPSSPITVTREPSSGGKDKSYVFRATGLALDEKEATVLIPVRRAIVADEPRFTSASFTDGDTPGDGGGSVEVSWAVANAPGGATYTIALVRTAGAPTTDETGGGSGFSSSPQEIVMALGSGAALQCTITMYDGATPVASTTFTSAVPT